MVLDEFIKRLQSLRTVTGGDVPVVIELNADDPAYEQFPEDDLFELAAAEVQNIVPCAAGIFRSTHDQNTGQVIKVY